MKVTLLKIMILALLTACGSSAGSGTKKKEVLVVGDSISWGYFPFVQEDLKAVANFEHNPDNAQNTVWTLEHIEGWLEKHYDLITWNNGLWDCNEREDIFTIPEEYRENLRLIAPKLLVSADRVIFFTTSEIPVNELGRSAGCETERNDIAREVMEEFGIEVFDLNAVSNDLDDYRVNAEFQNDVHYTRRGYRKLADFVTESIALIL